MRLAALIAAAFALSAGPAFACSESESCGRVDHHVHQDDGYRGHAQGYSEHRRDWRDRRCDEGCGELTLPASFFYDSGGVGPIPDSGFVGGGGFGFVDSAAFAGSRASAFASARAFAHASANVSIRFRGGFKGHHGGKGGKRH